VPDALRLSFERNLLDLGRLRRRALAYALHLRETNLAELLRQYPPGPDPVWAELRQCLLADLENYAAEQAADREAVELGLFQLGGPTLQQPWREAEDALQLLDLDPPGFLERFFTVTAGKAEKGLHSVTSR
jgi:hypothetical protein